MKQIYRIREYGSFIAEKEMNGYTTLSKRTFEQLENFILANRNKDTDALEMMGLSAKKGIGKVITAKNYVGIITMTDGTTVEILPKIYSPVEEDSSGAKTKKLLIEMLKTLRDSPYKSLQTSHVDLERMNIFEVFIRMFADEVFLIVKRGLKCDYEVLEENLRYLKGKMIFSQQIKHNSTHRERNYVQYDDFICNRPENRLLKATLLYLYRKSTSAKNRNDIKILLNAFGEVEMSTDNAGDFAKCVPDRNMKDYSIALLWSRVFLMGKSFTSFTGSDVALALLFPMETLFENYVAALLKKKLNPVEFSVTAQDKSHHLFDWPAKKFLLKPDIVVTRKSDHSIFVLDTKWKLLTENYGVSQPDMYQMYAYHKKYGAKNVTLLYPQTDNMPHGKNLEFASRDGANVNIQFVDLFDVQNSLSHIIQLFFEEQIQNERLG